MGSTTSDGSSDSESSTSSADGDARRRQPVQASPSGKPILSQEKASSKRLKEKLQAKKKLKKHKDRKSSKDKKRSKHKKRHRHKEGGEREGPVQLSKHLQHDGEKYSSVSGKKIKLKVAKSSADRAEDQSRSQLLAFLNSSCE